MNRNFTLWGIIAILFCGFNLSGQQANALFIDAPADIAGVYSAYQSTPIWGMEVEDYPATAATFVIDGEGAPADGCSIPIENVQGKIAFMDRSSCDMAEQALNAQQSGAALAIICNDRPALGIQNMHQEDATITDQVTIPVFAMSFYDCQAIRVHAEGGEIEASLGYYCEATPDPEVLWGNEPGQGDFSNGLGDWYVIKDDGSDTTWQWTADRVIQGAYSMNRYIVEGTACNGYMLFPSDYYDNNNMTDATGQPIFGAGLCSNSGNTGSFCVGSLYSPVIDLTGQDVEGLFCRFYHDWGYYYGGSTTLIASYDGGVTWPDSTYITLGELAAGLNPEVTIDGECQVATASVNERGEGTYTIPLLNYDGASSVQLQFRHYGGYYHATIDDVVLISGKTVDVSVERSFVGRAPAGRIPASQANNIPFHVDVYNTGNTTATDVAIKAEVFGPGGDLVWETTNDTYRDQPPFCFLNENNSFQDVFLPENEGGYRARYTNLTPDDNSERNDTLSFSWELTENIWAPVRRPLIDDEGLYNQMYDGLLANDPDDANFIGYKWAMAYTFYLPEGDGNFLNTVRFGINALPGNSGDIKAYLFLWNPEEGESFPADRNAGEYVIASSDMILLGCMAENSFGEKVNTQPVNALLQSSIDQTDMTIRMGIADSATGTPKLDADGKVQRLILQDDQMYALVFVMNPSQENKLEFLARSSGAGEAADLSATNFALDTLGYKQRYGASTSSLNNGGDYVTELSSLDWTGGYFNANQPWIEMEILPNDVSTEDLADPSVASLDVYPNPTSDVIYVKISLEDFSPKASFELMNVNGEIVKRVQHSDVKIGTYAMDTNDLPSGIYTLNVRTQAGFMTEKIILAK